MVFSTPHQEPLRQPVSDERYNSPMSRVFPSWRFALAVALLLSPCPSGFSSQATPSTTPVSSLAQSRETETQGDLREAMGSSRAAEIQDPNDARTSLRVGLLYGQAGDFVEAEAAFRRAIKLDPNLAEAHYNLGLAILAKSRNPAWDSADSEFKTCLQLRPNYSEAANMLGVGLLETGQTALAVAQFRSALLLDPHSAEIHFNLGRALEADGHGSEAYAEYLTAAQRKPHYAAAQKAIAKTLYLRKDYTSAIGYLNEALATDPDLENAHYLLGRVLRSQGKTAEAEIQFRLSAEEEQRRSDAIRSSHLSNQSLELARSGNFGEAVDTAQQAVTLAPENSVAHFNLGLLLADSGKLQAAVLEVRKAISLSPLHAGFYLTLSRMEQKLDRRDAAIASLQRATALNGSNPEIAAQLSALKAQSPAKNSSASQQPFPYGAPRNTSDDHYAFATQLASEGDLPGAVGELLHALSIAPARGDIRFNLAIAYMEKGDYERAELELRKVLLVDPNPVQTHIALGTALLQIGRLTDAAEEFRGVLKMEPNNRQAAQLLTQCQASAKS